MYGPGLSQCAVSGCDTAESPKAQKEARVKKRTSNTGRGHMPLLYRWSLPRSPFLPRFGPRIQGERVLRGAFQVRRLGHGGWCTG